MQTVKYLTILLGLVAWSDLATPSPASAQCCTSCGSENCGMCPRGCGKFRCECQCDKVCQPKHETKKVEVICWECVCKKVCLAGKSCGCHGTCSKSRVVKHLMKRTITKEVPIIKCEAVDVCDGGCAAGACGCAEGACGCGDDACGCGAAVGGCDQPAGGAPPAPMAQRETHYGSYLAGQSNETRELLQPEFRTPAAPVQYPIAPVSHADAHKNMQSTGTEKSHREEVVGWFSAIFHQ